MERLYFDEHIGLQEEFGTRKLANLLDTKWSHRVLSPDEQAFITSRDMFFLATVDKEGRPTVSYKGGPVGVVKVLDEKTLAFPGFDGNGMFYSLGNIVGQQHVGLLFIDLSRELARRRLCVCRRLARRQRNPTCLRREPCSSRRSARSQFR